jgi:hypothetical protein
MKTPRDKGPIILHLVSVPCEVPVANRLRSVLKRLLRDYGFRCIRIDGDGAEMPSETHRIAQGSPGRVEASKGTDGARAPQ